MSTRSVIARPDGDGWQGRYCHWDGYPTCRGRQLWQTFDQLGTVEAVRSYAIKEGTPGYWSSFLPPERLVREQAKPRKVVCRLCQGTGIRPDWAQVHLPGPGCNGCRDSGLADNSDRADGFRSDNGEGWITSTGDDMGTEWAYVLADHALIVFERRYGRPDEDHGHGTGMFGMGASDTDVGGYWLPVIEARWDEPEPNWEAIERELAEAAEARYADQ